MKDRSIFAERYADFRAVNLATLTTFVVVFISGCSSIWNASDLAVWVRDRAVEQGCQRETIELEEWYTETVEGDVWRGTCQDTQGNKKSFGINVDPVWTPSAAQPARLAPVIESDKSGKTPQ